MRAARCARGWSQLDLALAAGTNQPHIWAIETGAKRPNTDTLLRLAAALGCELRFAGYILSDISPLSIAS